MGLFDRIKTDVKQNGNPLDIIRCDQSDYLIWKWQPSGGQVGRENAIRFGSSLRVKDGEVAVFVYKQKDGTMQDFIVGPFDQIIKTANFPVLAEIIGLAYDGQSPFQAEVYFINLARLIQVRFAVPFFDVFDPRYPDFGVPVAVRGTISFGIEDYRAFVKLHRLNTFNLDDFQKQIRDTVSRYVKDAVANAPAAHNIPVVQIETKTAMINDAVEFDLSERLKETFGVVVSGVDIGTIEIDKSSRSYAQLMSITKHATGATIQAQTQAGIKDIHDKQRIDAMNYEETLRMQREEEQYARHMHTRTANFGAYQVEKQAEVGVAGAQALGQMGANGAGNVNFGDGSNGSGFNVAAMMANMAVGNAVGQNVANTMNNMMSGVQQPIQMDTVPPPVPTVSYHVAMNGQAAGPFDLSVLTQMVASGKLTKESLVWTTGMAQWVKAEDVDALKTIFPPVIPPIPKQE